MASISSICLKSVLWVPRLRCCQSLVSRVQCSKGYSTVEDSNISAPDGDCSTGALGETSASTQREGAAGAQGEEVTGAQGEGTVGTKGQGKGTAGTKGEEVTGTQGEGTAGAQGQEVTGTQGEGAAGAQGGDSEVRSRKEELRERARLVSMSCNAVDEDGVLLKPPSSHESPSLLYDPLANKFVNMLMLYGKKSQAQQVFMKSLELIKRTQIAKASKKKGEEKVMVNPMTIFYQAVENVKPVLGTRVIKRGGKPYHVPFSLKEKRRTFLACKWLIMSARQKRGMGVSKKLAVDFIDSYNHQGYAIKKKQDLHRLVDANRAYTHFRW